MIEPLRYEDIFQIGEWRNQQISILRQEFPLSHGDQEKYFSEVIEKTFIESKPKQMLFSYFLDQACIGYGGIVHIDWEKRIGEISFINKTERANNKIEYYKDLKNFISLIFYLGFNIAGMEKLTTETYSIRKDTLEILNDIGFAYKTKIKNNVNIEGKNYDSVFHEYDERNFNVNNEIKEIE